MTVPAMADAPIDENRIAGLDSTAQIERFAAMLFEPNDIVEIRVRATGERIVMDGRTSKS